MNTSAIMDLINDLEKRYSVDQWTVDGLHVWPYLRIKLNFDLFHAYYTSPHTGGSVFKSFTSQVYRLAKKPVKYCSATLIDFKNNAWPTKQVDAVLFSDGISYVSIENTWHEKFCDPLIATFNKNHLATFLISPLDNYYIPRYTPSLFIQPCLDIVHAGAYLTAGSQTPSSFFLKEYPDCCAYLSSNKIPVALPVVHDIHKQTTVIRRISKLYVSLLKRLQPSVAFVVSYYNIEGMAVNLACREIGIPSVDIQHGCLSDLHVAYARWNKIPETGYDLLPSYFLCWTDTEAATINKWSASVERWHRPLVGGNLWLQQWQEGSQDFIVRYDNRLKNILAHYPGRRHIIVTLQTGLANPIILANLLEAIKRGHPSWRWWIRLHPCMLHERHKIKNLLTDSGIMDFELDIATDLPLYALLRHLDLHITHSSSTVIEAALFSVPSIITSEFGAEFYHEQIKSGWALTAYTTEDIIAAIHTQLNSKADLQKKRVLSKSSPSKSDFDTLMSLFRKESAHKS